MRDLKADLELCNRATPGPWNGEENTGVEPVFETGCGCCTESTLSKEDAEFIAEAREGWPHAIERAIKAEAENAKLRKVADAAREFISSTGCNSKECKKCDPNIGFCMWSGIGQAIVELYKEPSND